MVFPVTPVRRPKLATLHFRSAYTTSRRVGATRLWVLVVPSSARWWFASARIWLHVGAFHEQIAAGTFKIGLKWVNTTDTPKIKVYRSTDPDGSDEYLKDEEAAFAQIGGDNAETLGEVAGSSALILPVELWADFSAQNPKVCLLFEGSGEGKGQLMLTIHKADGTEIGEGPGVWLELLDVKKMYVRGKASEEIDSPYDYGNTQPPDPGVTYSPDPNWHNFSEPPDEVQQTIVFVHGWRMPYDDSVNYAETMFKRLWHRGYKGRFASFRWPTFTSNMFDGWPEWLSIRDFSPALVDAIVARYNESEYRAWKSGAALKQFVAGLPYPDAKNICAHSMGNIVVGSALKQGMQVNNYVLMQAAVPAGAYNVGQSNHQAFVDNASNDPSPDGASDLGYRGYLTNVSGSLINFYNFEDDALEAWDENNIRFKPNDWITATQSYGYIPALSEGQRCKLVGLLTARQVFDPHESMAFVACSLTLAVGREPTGGSVGGGNHDLNSNYSFGDEHSAQWSWRIQQLKPFYDELINKLEVGPANP